MGGLGDWETEQLFRLYSLSTIHYPLFTIHYSLPYIEDLNQPRFQKKNTRLPAVMPIKARQRG